MGNVVSATIAETLRLFIEPGQVAELRALQVQQRYGLPKTVSGFFDSDHLDAMAQVAADLTTRAKGVYFTPNPVLLDLLASRCNRADIAEKNDATKDQHIIRRKWLLIDIDAKRPSNNVSSNDAERLHAFTASARIVDHLTMCGFPEPIAADSGNGAHVVYRIDLPADDKGIVKHILHYLKVRFDDEHVEVDGSVFNPSRIWKLYGTLARKGDSTADRPHRLAQLLTIPKQLITVPSSLLEQLAADVTLPGEKAKAPARSNSSACNGNGFYGHAPGADVHDRARKYIVKMPPSIEGQHGSDRLFAVACALVLGFDIGVDEALPILDEWNQANATPPWSEPELRHKLMDAHKKPGDRGYLLNGKSHSWRPTSTALPTEDASAAIPLTDDGNAQRLVQAHGAELRHCHPWRKWLVWDGKRWAMDDEGVVMALAKDTVRVLFAWAKRKIDELEKMAAGDSRAAIALARIRDVLKWTLQSQNVNRIKAAVDLARSEAGIPTLPAKLDAPSWLLNVNNGTLDLQTGQLRPHSQDDMLTKLAPVMFDPTAKCPTWERFLWRIMAGRQALIDYLQRAVGYSLTGSVREQVLFFLHGEGANGKSTFLETIKHVMGEYASTAAPDLLLVRQGEPHPTQLADLHGRRFVSTVEVDDGRRLAESLVKQLTGGDSVKARRMREDFWEITPTWKIWLAANHRPEIRGNDHAIWRRIRLVPFDVKIPAEEQDKDLLDKLKSEASGIFAWSVRGCADWLRIGLADPPEVLSATEAYKSESDLIGSFLAECNTGSPNYRSRTSELYTAFSTWAERQGEQQTMTGKRFGMELRRRGIQLDDGRRWYIGVSLKDPTREGEE